MIYMPLDSSQGNRWERGRPFCAAKSSDRAIVPGLMSNSPHSASRSSWVPTAGPYSVLEYIGTDTLRTNPASILLAYYNMGNKAWNLTPVRALR